MHERRVQAHDSFLPGSKPRLDRLPLGLGDDLVEFIGVVQQQHIVFCDHLWHEVFRAFGDVHIEAVFMAEQHQPAIDAGNVGMPVVGGGGEDEHLHAVATRSCRSCGIMSKGEAGEEEENEGAVKHGGRDSASG